MAREPDPGSSDSARRELARELRSWARLSPRGLAFNLVYLAAVWAIVLTSVVVAALWPNPLTLALGFVLVSSRQQALLNVEHECIHGIFVPQPRWNAWIGSWLCAYPCGSPYHSTRQHHLTHHRHLGTDQDPDAPLHRGTDKQTARGLLRHFLVGLFGGYALRVLFSRAGIETDPAVRLRDRRNLVAVQIALFATTTVLFDWWVYPILWLAPLGTLTTVSHLLRSYCEHALSPEEEPAHAERLVTVVSNRLERFLVAPYFMSYHAEHHLYPWVPAPRLPEVRARLDARPEAAARLVRKGYLHVFADHLVRASRSA